MLQPLLSPASPRILVITMDSHLTGKLVVHLGHLQKPVDLDLQCLLGRICPESEYVQKMP